MDELPRVGPALEWQAKADGDLRSAQALLALEPPEADAVAFHSQQAAEKYLKALLVAHDVEPPRTHDLSALLDLAVELAPQVDELREACSYLTPFAVQTRYPLFEPPISNEDATLALARSSEVCEAIRELLSNRHAIQEPGRLPEDEDQAGDPEEDHS